MPKKIKIPSSRSSGNNQQTATGNDIQVIRSPKEKSKYYLPYKEVIFGFLLGWACSSNISNILCANSEIKNTEASNDDRPGEERMMKGSKSHRRKKKTNPTSNTKISNSSSEWRLWHEMSPDDQNVALERAMSRARPYGQMLGRDASKFHNLCADGNKPILFGTGGEHMVCGPPPDSDARGCKFFSFGIRDDPSFDIHLAGTWKCRGFAGDPSITHPSKLHPAVSFHNIGLKMLRSNAEQRVNPEDEWILSSLPSLRQTLGWDYLDIVKIDCEGCEVAMARDILAEDPSFLDKVGQISIETHGTRTWVNTTEELYYYALMFPLLEDAGFKLIWSSVFGCGKYEHDGCRPEMQGAMGMSCGNRPRNAINLVPIGWSCHDWLWARV